MQRSDFSMGLGLMGLTTLGACASMFLNGGHFSDGSEQSRVLAKYKVESCADTASGAPLQGTTEAEYWLIREKEGTALAEMDRTGKGTVITNAWPEADGDHYFAWVQQSGWEYVIPRERDKNATRIVYSNLSTGKVGGVTKPTSSPNAKCVMKPMSPAGPAPAASSAPVTPTATAAPAETTAPPPGATPVPPPATTAEPAAAGAQCVPACRQSYVCVHGQCVSACNPPCATGERCTGTGECEPDRSKPKPKP
ncbi:MAG: hypothetical protein U0263_37980 [Polyangiaceae bacterium]